jgi:hypothetical protein
MEESPGTFQDLQKAMVPISVAIAVAGIVLLTWWRIAEAINTSIEIQMRPLIVQLSTINDKVEDHRRTEYHRGVPGYLNEQARRIDDRLIRIENKLDSITEKSYSR